MKQYYYAVGDDKKGPISLDELKAAGITPDTLVWHEGMDNWAPAIQLSELTDLFGGLTPSAPSMDDVKSDLDDAASAAGDAVEKVGDAAKDLAGAASDTLNSAVDKAGDLASEAVDAAGDVLDDAADAAEELANKAGDMLGGAANKAGSVASGAGAAAAGAMAGAAGAASGAFGKASGALGNASAAMSGFKGDILQEVRPNGPLKNWKTESIIAVVLSVVTCSCFALPTSIIGLIFALKVDKQAMAGAYREAASSANTAKTLFIVTAILLVLSIIVNVVFSLFGALGDAL